MIYEKQLHPEDTFQGIIFDEHEKSRLIKVLERGLNTLSPPDMELIKLLEDMKNG